MSKEQKFLTKEFGLTTWSVENKTSVIIFSLIVAIFGVWTYVIMPKESFPEIVIPQIYIGTSYPGNSPVDMENLISRPIEKELKSLSGVKSIKSTSVQDFSSIIVEFNPGVNIPKALQDVKDRVDKAKSELPNDLQQDPNVFEISFSEIPIMFINISGNYKPIELKTHAEYLEDEIEKLSGVSRVDIKGTPAREIRIDADIFKMEAMKVSFGDISQAIASENITSSGGNVKAGDFRRSIRVASEFKSVEDIRNVVVKSEDGNIVYLRDVAEVNDTDAEPKSYARASKLPVVTLNIIKRSGENMLVTSDNIKAIIDKAKAGRFPKDLNITITTDQSKQVRYMVSNLENNIISGVILVVGVLLFFMGLRSALFVGIAIPMSMFMSFIVLQMMGVTMNMMVLFSLILALGMLVDNGIVVIENIYRLMEEGYPLKKAIKEGVGEIAVPIISSTATTVAAFFPILFWQSIMGEFMKFLPLTLIITLSCSLFVALVINPAVAVIFAKLDKGESKVTRRNVINALIFILLSIPFYLTGSFTMANILMTIGLFILLNIYALTPMSNWFQNVALVKLENAYGRLVYWALSGKRPYFIFGGTFALLFFSIFLMANAGLKVDFFPPNEPMYINIFIEKPIGTDIATTNALTKKIEEKVIKMMKPYEYMVEALIAQVGEGTSDPMSGMMAGNNDTPNKAKITISFADFELRRGKNTGEILEELRDEMKNYAGVQIVVDKNNDGPPVGPPINIEIAGDNFERLMGIAEKMRKYIESANIAGIEELRTDLETGNPEILVNVDREKARAVGLSSQTVAQELRTALFGFEVSKYKEGEEDYPIQLRLKDEQRYDVEALKNKPITINERGNYKQIPISSVADMKYTSTYGSIKRKNLDKVVTLFSNVKEGYNANEIVAQAKTLMEGFDMPEGYSFKFTGEQEEQQESSDFLLRAFVLALFLVFLIIVTQFNSLTAPIIIMFSVLFSTIGVFLGLVIFRMDFVILMTGIGIISLAGVVVNNAIVLIDYTNLLRERRKAELGMEPDDRLPVDEFIFCLAEAGKTRLRPVLLTAITTVLGLIPLATGLNIDFIKLYAEFDPNIYMGGENAAFFGPMAWTVIFGLTFATFLTLVVVPVMYLLSDKLKIYARKEKKPIKVSF
jgi:multidrug efflux pump subunit AcrB